MKEASVAPETPYPVQGDLEGKKNAGTGKEQREHAQDLKSATAFHEHAQITNYRARADGQVHAQKVEDHVVGAFPVQPPPAHHKQHEGKWEKRKINIGRNREGKSVDFGGEEVAHARGKKTCRAPERRKGPAHRFKSIFQILTPHAALHSRLNGGNFTSPSIRDGDVKTPLQALPKDSQYSARPALLPPGGLC